MQCWRTMHGMLKMEMWVYFATGNLSPRHTDAHCQHCKGGAGKTATYKVEVTFLSLGTDPGIHRWVTTKAEHSDWAATGGH